MSNEKVIIDLCSSSDEEEDNFADENRFPEELEKTEEEEEEDRSSSEDDSDVDYDMDNDETGQKGHAAAAADDDKVTRLLSDGNDLVKSLNVKECKAYLRKHGLRLSGTKPVFIERILEHWRIKDGSGESLYPISSFPINCKGDVCKGDTVLFTQKVKGSGKIMGRRTVAGQVVKESYGTAKQQHTFTIEVLWSEGMQQLPPLYPLLVKGRNLYRLMTRRQRWANEDERVKVLSEKHSRGADARKVMRERKIKLGYVLKDGRLQKPGHVRKPLQVNTRQNDNQTQMSGQDIPANHSLDASQGAHKNPPFHSHNSHTYAPQPPRAPLTYAPRPYAPFSVPHSHLPPPHLYAYSTQQNQSIQRPPPAFFSGRPTTSNAFHGQASFNPLAHTNHASSNNGYNDGMRLLDHFVDMLISLRREGNMNHNIYLSNSNNNYNPPGDTHRQSRDTYRPNHREQLINGESFRQ
ncbi:hypothetical protein N665_0205s0053 [Sinapis alba]|nr:hypothetical protein N665_0205s0053 [Sinapis alba]